ncbi:hypothetical protein PV10_07833 [Exophiala mesophila]|uniref:Stress activated MAP kinase interacting protein n=1 Tax=Exophiala mesophila TaxID=212818 RepID=A0A0D1XR41_EXOME|nr:uncharacterized protein PV10_07833 [Exophiala mesophila]KIV90541.1 hypothetical protein PV10_07833 [Exophiala mesophila]
MALLQNEEFAIWYLRTSYLASVKDGVAERLINVNSSILNTPGFRAAGWSADPVQRTYSPPIPTAINSEYFQTTAELQLTTSAQDEDDEGGLVTGRTSNDTIGPGFNARRRRKREHVEDDDSSDLTDESEEEAEGAQRAAQQIRFAKMPSRNRADSSPIRTSNGPEALTSSPSKRFTDNRRRTGSLGAVEAVKARARRDTTTSSDMSSENEVDPAYFQRRQLYQSHSSRSGTLPVTGVDDSIRHLPSLSERGDLHDDSDADSDGSALSSDLGGTVDSESILNPMTQSTLTSSPPGLHSLAGAELPLPVPESPRRHRTVSILHELPPPRPISMMQPTSLLSAAFNAQKKTPENPIQAFATMSGKGTPNPLWIKMYAPFSDRATEPLEMPLARNSQDGNAPSVAELIGFGLWTYGEEERQPNLAPEQLNVNKWTLRIVEDGEVDDDFPPLGRTRPVTDFTYNNNRGGRARSREKSFDEFALVEASPTQLEANNKETPQFTPPIPEEVTANPAMSLDSPPSHGPVPARVTGLKTNILLAGQPFTSALSNTALTPADRPAPAGPQATPRMGLTKTIKVRYFDLQMATQTMTMELSADSYIAEILDHVCKRWNLEKAGFLLKVAGTNTVAPLDRTIEALGNRSDLDLVRKRFGAGVSLTGSPGSASPNAPLLLDIQGVKKGKKGQSLHPLAQKQDLMSSSSNFKKYYVTRKQLAPFAQGSQRVLVFDGDTIHVMPADSTSSAKFSSIAFNDILRCKVSTKHSKLVRVLVRRVNESKRYDFEARTAGEAQEIVDEVIREMRLARA